MQDNKTNPAAEYAAAIVEEVQALDRMMRGYHVRHDASLQEFWDDCETLGVDPDTLDIDSDALGAWLGNCLAVEVFVGSVRRDARRVEVLRTCGGPHCEITRSNDDGAAVTVTVHDGSDTATVRLYVAAVAEALDEFADSFEGVAR